MSDTDGGEGWRADEPAAVLVGESIPRGIQCVSGCQADVPIGRQQSLGMISGRPLAEHCQQSVTLVQN